VNSGNTGQIAYYNGTGTAVSGINAGAEWLRAAPAPHGTELAHWQTWGQQRWRARRLRGPVNAQSVEGQLQADQWQSPAGTGNNGIAMSMAQCAQQAYVCSIVAPALYSQVEAQPWGSGNALEMNAKPGVRPEVDGSARLRDGLSMGSSAGDLQPGTANISWRDSGEPVIWARRRSSTRM
jgi:hypothetical protein